MGHALRSPVHEDQRFGEGPNPVGSERGFPLKGKPFQSRPKTPLREEVPPPSLKKPLSSQVSKVDWQSDKLTNEQWRFLNRLFTQFAEFLAPHLTPTVQLRAIVELEEVARQPFKDFIEQFSAPTPLAVFTPDEKNKGILAVDPVLGFCILDHLMGGKGEALEEIREFTDIERVLFQKHVLGKFLSAHAEAWKDITLLNPKLEQMEFSPHNLVLFPYGETMLTSRFVLRLGGMSGGFQMALPLRYVRGILPRNPDEFATQSSLRKIQESQAPIGPVVGKKIETAPVPVTVELGKAEVLFQELLGLEEGDILRLETARDERLRIKVAGKTKFLGKPGSRENKVAVQITDIVQEGDDSFDD